MRVGVVRDIQKSMQKWAVWVLVGGVAMGGLVAVVSLKAAPGADRAGAAVGVEAPAAAAAPGKWAKPRRRAAVPTVPLSEEEERLAAIGYVEATTVTAGARVVPVWHRKRAEDGLNLLTSGHGAEVQLRDMDGSLVHRWAMTWQEAFPASKVKPLAQGTHHFRRARLANDGTIYAIFEGRGMVAIRSDGTLKWAMNNAAHHDLQIIDDGKTILALVRGTRMDEALRVGKPVLDDAVVWIDAETGAIRRKVLLWDALYDADLVAEARGRRAQDDGDLLHANSVFSLDNRLEESLPAWKAGRVLVSMREPSMLVVVDMKAGKIVDWRRGPYARQHDAEIGPDGNLWVFDNVGARVGARVLAMDPVSGEQRFLWGHTAEHPLRSAVLGCQQHLPGGNLLITESNGGRAVEVDPKDGAVVWELLNPNRAPADPTLLATIFEVERIPRAHPSGWTSPPNASRASGSGRGPTPQGSTP